MSLAADCYNPRHLQQTAVYWERAGNNRAGQPAFNAAVEIECKWDDDTVEFFSPDGRKLLSKAVIIVGQDLKPGSALALAELADVEDLNFPYHPTNPKAWEIQGWAKTGNLAGTKFVREVFL